ncbi:MAG: hypothetical protein LBM96_07010 [Methanobrevibacter sp.]|jgi:hypothetical protein|nr:hypothetical protein [Candidatus Methanoflexus mossambicus]
MKIKGGKKMKKYINFFQLKKAFDINKGKIHLSKKYYIHIFANGRTEVAIFDKEILGKYKAIAKFGYDERTEEIILWLADNGVIIYENKSSYALTDNINKLNDILPNELVLNLKKYYKWRFLWKIKNQINLILKKDK